MSEKPSPVTTLKESAFAVLKGVETELECRDLLADLREDTINEFTFALDQDRPFIDTDILPKAMIPFSNRRPEGWNKNLSKRHVLFLLFSNLINQTDAGAEASIAAANNPDAAIKATNYYDNPQFFERIEIIKATAEAWQIDVSFIDEGTQRFINGIAQGNEMVARSIDEGKIAYDVDEAITYRHETVGVYAWLLAKLAFTDPAKQEGFVKRMMGVQINDDKSDVIEDYWVQPNPFVALVDHFGLGDKLKDYLDRIGRIDPRFDHLKQFIRDHADFTVINHLLERVDSIGEAYLEAVNMDL